MILKPHDSFWNLYSSNYLNTWPRNNANWIEKMFFAKRTKDTLPRGIEPSDVLILLRHPVSAYKVIPQNFSRMEHLLHF